jgi:DNA invertase Pin-like site-specific DNA recombinase
MVERVALYVRVSTDGQTVENQVRELKDVAERHGWRIVEMFDDNGICTAKVWTRQRQQVERCFKC